MKKCNKKEKTGKDLKMSFVKTGNEIFSGRHHYGVLVCTFLKLHFEDQLGIIY